MGYTRKQKRDELGRELGMRRRLYPLWVKQGRMSAEDAESQIKIMAAIYDDYVEVDRMQKQFDFSDGGVDA